MKKVLVTGISGFVGKHLAEYFLSTKQYDIVGTYNSEGGAEKLGSLREQIQLERVDLTQMDSISNLITTHQPAYIVHLAGLTFVPESYKKPFEYMATNIQSGLNILEVLREHNFTTTRLLIVSTAEMYGLVQSSDLPLKETSPFNPTSPYAVSKIAQDYLGLQYFLSYKLDVIRVRPFNHIGPGQNDRFVVSDFAKQIVEIEKQKKEPVIHVGNLEARRDFTDVRDIAKGYEILLRNGKAGESYNIGSGVSHAIQEILDILLSLSTVKITVEPDLERLRPSDNPDIVCDYTKLHAVTGWEPEIPLEKTLQDALNYWRALI